MTSTDPDPWVPEDFVGSGGAHGFDVTTDMTSTLRSKHKNLADRLRDDDFDDDRIHKFVGAELAAVTRELAYRRRLRVVPADYADATQAAVEMLKARDDVVDEYDTLWLRVTLTPDHTSVSSLFAPFEYDVQDVGVDDDGNPVVSLRIGGFSDGVDRVREKHFFGRSPSPTIDAAVLK